MKLSAKIAILASAIALAACAPRDTTHHLSINDALKSPEAAEVLNPNIKLYFGTPAPGKVVLANSVTNKKTNAANKTDEKACQWAFLSAVKQLQDKAASKEQQKSVTLLAITKRLPLKAAANMNAMQVILLAA